ncbi:acetyltransferase [Streptacidiphilus jiangxiensis]|uniref:Sugar O-acyltransferase, sialic acid O-acetyltransferase NeuD family n=1 Tax=Streptacidiphilus jiangxiensis TaxID=235985 RepID=A0A1H7XKZ0_STRJI|nr:acetyltransferase [Streptacidiphilus jiangxiensis]SEM33837.1 sugar O-acyltransferase, sialic acid O-acetyltransferase NeuD family [Streptacidiphilus jiangxiensis]
MKGLLIVGAGGFARETAQVARAANGPDAVLGHLDDDPARQGTEVDGLPVLGGSELVHAYPEAPVVVCVGNPRDWAGRARLVRRLGLPEQRYGTVVHPSASVAESAEIGPGSVLLAQCALTASVRVGAHVAVMPQVVLTHDDVVGDFATLTSGVRLGGGVRVGEGAYVGAGALVREGVSVGAWSQLGMGALLLEDLPPGEVWIGSPARKLRSVPDGALNELQLARGAGNCATGHPPT